MAKRRQPTLAITQPHAKFLVSCRRLMSNALSQNFKKIAPLVQKLWPKNWRLALLYYRGGLFGLCLLDVLFGDILHVGNQGIWIFDNRIIGFQVTGGSHGEDPHCKYLVRLKMLIPTPSLLHKNYFKKACFNCKSQHALHSFAHYLQF